MLHLPAGDVFLHCGDFSKTGETEQVLDFHEWVQSLDFKYKIVIAGNHDITFDVPFYEQTGRAQFHDYQFDPYDAVQTRRILADSSAVTYLEDSSFSFQMHGGRINMYGSPWQPAFCQWAFNYPSNGPEARSVWEQVRLVTGPVHSTREYC